MQPAAFDNSPGPCRHSSPIYHTTGRWVSDTIQEDHRWSGSASTALPQTMRTLESQQRRGPGSVEMNEHMAGLAAKVHLREQCIMGWSRIEGRNDGGCEQRAAKDFAKFSCSNSKRLNQHVTSATRIPCGFSLESSSRDSTPEIKTVCVSCWCIGVLNCPFTLLHKISRRTIHFIFPPFAPPRNIAKDPLSDVKPPTHLLNSALDFTPFRGQIDTRFRITNTISVCYAEYNFFSGKFFRLNIISQK